MFVVFVIHFFLLIDCDFTWFDLSRRVILCVRLRLPCSRPVRLVCLERSSVSECFRFAVLRDLGKGSYRFLLVFTVTGIASQHVELGFGSW